MLTTSITDNLSRKKPTARESFIKVIKDSLEGISLKIIDTHNTASAIFIIQDNASSMLLKAEFGQDTATHREIVWYKHQVATNKDNQKLFIRGERTDTYALLFLRYIEGALTLDEWALQTTVEDSGLSRLVLKALAYDRSLFAESSRNVQQSVAERFVMDKYHARRKEAGRTAYLDELLSISHVSINGKLCLTPDFAMAKITKNSAKMKWLLPVKMGLVHGDLHTGNILTKDGELYYVDPNGSLTMPIEYDIGKLLHSVHGQYPLIMQGKFLVSGGARDTYEYIVYKNAIYSEAYDNLRNGLTHEEYLRSLYAEALHFATMLPHHTKNREETIALFLRAVELFDELLTLL